MTEEKLTEIMITLIPDIKKKELQFFIGRYIYGKTLRRIAKETNSWPNFVREKIWRIECKVRHPAIKEIARELLFKEIL